jgi:WD40 repeat protein
MLVTAGADKVARLRRVDDGTLLHELPGHDRRIVAASFSPDGRRLVTASLDKTARIWDTATGAPDPCSAVTTDG